MQALNMPEIAAEAFTRVEDQYAEENKKQLFEGFDKHGDYLQEYKSPVYAEVKNRMNPLPGFGNPDFYVTGAFTNSRKITISGDQIITTFSDEKAPQLLARDPDINGLGGGFKAEFVSENLRPSFISTIREKTGL